MFGNCHVALFGDHYQLPPVNSPALHAKKVPRKFARMYEWFRSIQNVRVLTNQRRFADQPMLLSIALAYRSGGAYTKEHVEFCNQRRITVQEINLESSILMVATRKEKARIYELQAAAMLQANLGSPRVVCWAAHFTSAQLLSKSRRKDVIDEDQGPSTESTQSGKRKKIEKKRQNPTKKHEVEDFTFDTFEDSVLHDVYRSINRSVVVDDNSDNILAFSAFCVGQLVNITKNQSVEAGLANGTFARILWFDFPEGTQHHEKDIHFFGRKVRGTVYSSPPATIWVELVKPSIHIPGLGTRLRPIGLHKTRAKFSWPDGRDAAFSFQNVPLLPACAMTVHSMQGKTIPEGLEVVAFDKSPFYKNLSQQAWYVMMTR